MVFADISISYSTLKVFGISMYVDSNHVYNNHFVVFNPIVPGVHQVFKHALRFLTRV